MVQLRPTANKCAQLRTSLKSAAAAAAPIPMQLRWDNNYTIFVSRLTTFNHKQRDHMIWARLSMNGEFVELFAGVVALPSSSSNACKKSKFIFEQTHLLAAYRKRPSGRTKNPSSTQHSTPRKYIKQIRSHNKSAA